MIRVHIDFETRSKHSVKDVGPWVYSVHPSTRPLCLAYKIDNGPIRSITKEDLDHRPESLKELESLALNKRVIFIAHNAFFEQCIWQNIMIPRYGLPPIPIRRWRCTAAKAAAMTLPRSLDMVGKYLNLPVQKDTVGGRVMLKLSKPRRPTKTNEAEWCEPEDYPDDFETLYAYNITDVEVEYLVDKELPDLNPREQEAWFLDQEINFRGIKCDIPAINQILLYIDKTQEFLIKEFRQLTQGYVNSPSQVSAYKDWLGANGLTLPNLQAPTVDEAIGNLPDGPVRRTLEIRRSLSKISTAKYTAILERVDSADGRLRDCFLYCAAITKRWGGRGVQLQNLPKGVVCSDTCIQTILLNDYEWFLGCYPDPFAAFSSSIRGTFIADKGDRLIVSDLNAIEARVLSWLAEEEKSLQVFRNNGDLYCEEAAKIYGRTIRKTDKYERSVGKVAVLALGYNGGISAFGTMARSYGLDLEPAYSFLWPTASTEEREKARQAYERYVERASKGGELNILGRAAGYASDIIKQRWRAANPNIVQLWKTLEASAIKAVLSGEQVTVGSVIFGMYRDYLLCRLPSGSCISYPSPKISERQTPWGTPVFHLSYVAQDSKNYQHYRIGTYGGKLAENITQAVSRDVLVDSMMRLEKAGYPTVLHVHDEVVSEVPIGFGSVEEHERILSTPLDWAPGLPLKAEGWTGQRYKKG